MDRDNFKHATLVVVTARKGESMADAIERTVKTMREQAEAECGGCCDCEERCGATPDPRANVKNPDYSPLRNVAMRPSYEAEFSPKCNPMPCELGCPEALEYALRGSRIARSGWNGKDQWVKKIPAGNATYQGYDMQDCLGLKNAQGQMQPGWLPSQGDIFAKDWMVLD